MHNLSCENEYNCMRMKNDFHIKGWAPIPSFWNRGPEELGNGLLHLWYACSLCCKVLSVMGRIDLKRVGETTAKGIHRTTEGWCRAYSNWAKLFKKKNYHLQSKLLKRQQCKRYPYGNCLSPLLSRLLFFWSPRKNSPFPCNMWQIYGLPALWDPQVCNY